MIVADCIKRGKTKYYYEVNMDNSYADRIVDEFGCAYVWIEDERGKVGADYNFCYNGRYENSAIYKDNNTYIDGNTYMPYEIDFSFDDWKQRLINAMVDCVERWWKSEKRDEY